MNDNDQNVTVPVPPGARVIVITAQASAVVTRADGTIKED